MDPPMSPNTAKICSPLTKKSRRSTCRSLSYFSPLCSKQKLTNCFWRNAIWIKSNDQRAQKSEGKSSWKREKHTLSRTIRLLRIMLPSFLINLSSVYIVSTRHLSRENKPSQAPWEAARDEFVAKSPISREMLASLCLVLCVGDVRTHVSPLVHKNCSHTEDHHEKILGALKCHLRFCWKKRGVKVRSKCQQSVCQRTNDLFLCLGMCYFKAWCLPSLPGSNYVMKAEQLSQSNAAQARLHVSQIRVHAQLYKSPHLSLRQNKKGRYALSTFLCSNWRNVLFVSLQLRIFLVEYVCIYVSECILANEWKALDDVRVRFAIGYRKWWDTLVMPERKEAGHGLKALNK